MSRFKDFRRFWNKRYFAWANFSRYEQLCPQKLLTTSVIGSATLVAVKSAYPVQVSEHNENPFDTKSSKFGEFREFMKQKYTNLTLPEHVPYVLLGGGTASYYAALTIRAYDPDAKVLIVSAEDETPYNRPPLSKELWLYGTPSVTSTLEYLSLSGKKRDIRYESDGFFVSPGSLADFEHGAISLLKKTRAVEIDHANKEVVLDSGKKIKFDKLLIATGSKPRIPFPFYFPHLRNKVMTYHSISDFRKLSYYAQGCKSILIFGDSILATELSYALSAKFGKDLQIVYAFTDEHLLQKTLPKTVSQPIETALANAGVKIQAGSRPIAVDKLPDGQVAVIFDKNGVRMRIVVDHIVIADSHEPSTRIAKMSGIDVDEKTGGIIADEKLQTSVPDIYAAGDVAAYKDPVFGRVRVERWENAQITGRLAGQNMTGNVKDFHHRPEFISAFGHDVHLNGIGNIDASLKTKSVFSSKQEGEGDNRGVIFYLLENKVVGVLLLNIFGVASEIARRIIADNKEITDFKELAKLFDLYQPPQVEEEFHNAKAGTVSDSFEDSAPQDSTASEVLAQVNIAPAINKEANQ